MGGHEDTQRRSAPFDGSGHIAFVSRLITVFFLGGVIRLCLGAKSASSSSSSIITTQSGDHTDAVLVLVLFLSFFPGKFFATAGPEDCGLVKEGVVGDVEVLPGERRTPGLTRSMLPGGLIFKIGRIEAGGRGPPMPS